MGDALQELARVEGLSPRDSILGRALLRQGIVDPSSVLEAARAAAEAPSAIGILDRLTASGVLTDERARKLEAALQKRIAERRSGFASRAPARPADGPAPASAKGEPLGKAEPVEEAEAIEDAEAVDDAELIEQGSAAEAPPGTEPQPRSGGPRMWRRRSSRTSAPRKTAGPPSKAEVRETVDAFVKRFVCSRTHQLVLESLLRAKATVADPKALARKLGLREKEVLRVLKDWRAKGLLRTVDTFPFCYEPSSKDKEAAGLFVTAWRKPAEHGRLLSLILEMESK